MDFLCFPPLPSGMGHMPQGVFGTAAAPPSLAAALFPILPSKPSPFKRRYSSADTPMAFYPFSESPPTPASPPYYVHGSPVAGIPEYQHQTSPYGLGRGRRLEPLPHHVHASLPAQPHHVHASPPQEQHHVYGSPAGAYFGVPIYQHEASPCGLGRGRGNRQPHAAAATPYFSAAAPYAAAAAPYAAAAPTYAAAAPTYAAGAPMYAAAAPPYAAAAPTYEHDMYEAPPAGLYDAEGNDAAYLAAVTLHASEREAENGDKNIPAPPAGYRFAYMPLQPWKGAAAAGRGTGDEFSGAIYVVRSDAPPYTLGYASRAEAAQAEAQAEAEALRSEPGSQDRQQGQLQQQPRVMGAAVPLYPYIPVTQLWSVTRVMRHTEAEALLGDCCRAASAPQQQQEQPEPLQPTWTPTAGRPAGVSPMAMGAAAVAAASGNTATAATVRKPASGAAKAAAAPRSALLTKGGRTAKGAAGKPTAKSAGKPTAKSAGKPTAKSAAKPTAKSAGKPTAKGAGKPTAKCAGKPTAKGAGKATAKRVRFEEEPAAADKREGSGCVVDGLAWGFKRQRCSEDSNYQNQKAASAAAAAPPPVLQPITLIMAHALPMPSAAAMLRPRASPDADDDAAALDNIMDLFEEELASGGAALAAYIG